MPPEILVALIGLGGLALAAVGGLTGHLLTSRAQKRAALITAEANQTNAEHLMINQLQEELERYRKRTDERLDTLETENRGYRAFIGIQRDHMAAHNIPLPPWPDGLAR